MTTDDLPLAAWGLDGSTVTPLGGGTANLNLRVSHGERRYVLRRRSPRYAAQAQITFDHALMQCLAKQGIRGPNPIPTVSGETVARAGDAVFELHEYLPGEPIVWDNMDHLAIAARALRRFQDAAARFISPHRKEWPREDDPRHIREGLAELREVIREPRQVEVLDILERWADRIAEVLPDDIFWGLPCQVIHGDFHPGNVHVAGTTLGIFDLDCASYQPRARDLADGLLYFCAHRDGPFDASNIIRLTRECRLEPARNRMFLDAYGAIDEAERRALPWLVAARWIYSRVRGRIKLPRSQWPDYATHGILTPLDQLGVDEPGRSLAV